MERRVALPPPPFTWEFLGFCSRAAYGEPGGEVHGGGGLGISQGQGSQSSEQRNVGEESYPESSAHPSGSPLLSSREQRDTFVQGAAWFSGKEPLDRMGIVRGLTDQEQFL